jgi:SAM-dependent methyltransferase
MHLSALNFGRLFFDIYASHIADPVIVEVGSQIVAGTLRDVAPKRGRYIGLDFVPGKGVDAILEDPYVFPLESGMADAVVSSSCFEHSQFFWLTFLEALRLLKPEGVLYINVPSNGIYHRYPFDNWRFYPDAGIALTAWARRSGYDAALVESFLGWQEQDAWNDFVAVFARERTRPLPTERRMYKEAHNPTNIIVGDSTQPLNYMQDNQDMRRIRYIGEGVIKLFNEVEKI